MAWTFFATPGLRWLGPAPSEFLWEGRSRTFCPACGTPLTFFDPSLPHQFEVTTCSLSEPAAETPVDHNWVCDRLRWFDTADNLPRFTRNTP